MDIVADVEIVHWLQPVHLRGGKAHAECTLEPPLDEDHIETVGAKQWPPHENSSASVPISSFLGRAAGHSPSHCRRAREPWEP